MADSKAIVSGLGDVISEAPEADVDARLVERVKAGEIAAFDRLVEKYRDRLFGVIYHMTSNREDARDLVQESFIKAFRSMDRFRGQSAFYTWLYRIGVNATLSHLRRHRLRRFLSLEQMNEGVPGEVALEFLTSRSRTEKPVLMKELQGKLNEALQTLSSKHRTVVVLFEIEDLSHEAIAEIMGCSVGTVRSRLHYARKQLQGLLAAYLK